MPKLLLSLALLCSLLPGKLFPSQLIIPEAFDVIKVNGKKNKTFLFSNNRKIKLEKGSYQIELRYQDFYDKSFDDFEKITSEPFIISFDYDGQEDLTTNFIKPKTISEAKTFAENPNLKILKKSGAPFVSKVQKGPTTPTKAKSRSPNNPQKPSTQTAEKNSSALTQLQYWWKKANLEQRQQFMKEILQ